MSQASQPVAELARKNERAVLQAFSRLSQSRIAEQMGASDSTVSRMKEGPLEQFCLLLAACGLKAIPTGMKCFSQEKVHALLTLARDHLVQMEHPEELGADQLSWEI